MVSISRGSEIPLTGVPLWKEILKLMNEKDSVVLPEMQGHAFCRYIRHHGGDAVTRKEGIGTRRVFLLKRTENIVIPVVIQHDIRL